MATATREFSTEYRLEATGLTAAEYLRLPADYPQCELISSELWIPPSPSFEHQDVLGALAIQLKDQVDSRSNGKVMIAPLDVELSDDTVVQPDILLLAPDHPQVRGEPGIITVPPILVIEVLSPSSITHDRQRKFRAYESAGVPNCWLVDLEAKRIEAWVLEGDRYSLLVTSMPGKKFSAPPFPELDLDLSEIFPATRK